MPNRPPNTLADPVQALLERVRCSVRDCAAASDWLEAELTKLPELSAEAKAAARMLVLNNSLLGRPVTKLGRQFRDRAKRGRPLVGSRPMTPAERKRRSRARR